MRVLKRIISAVALLAIGFGVGWAWPILVRPPLVVGQDAITSAATTRVKVTVEDAGGRVIVARPPEGTAEQPVLVIIYPGGLVRPQAYEWLARREAALGRTAVIPEFAFDLAVFDSGRADKLIAQYGKGRTVVLAGHSLGGAMAAQYLSDKEKQGPLPVAGLILMGAYPPDGVDLSAAKLKVLDLAGEHDQVADLAEVTEGLKRLPAGTTIDTIDGSVHAFFGRYGPQSGDGLPTVTRDAAQTQIGALIDTFIADLT